MDHTAHFLYRSRVTCAQYIQQHWPYYKKQSGNWYETILYMSPLPPVHENVFGTGFLGEGRGHVLNLESVCVILFDKKSLRMTSPRFSIFLFFVLAMLATVSWTAITGCLAYTGTACKTCDATKNWVLSSGTCKCHKGYQSLPGCLVCVRVPGSGTSTQTSESHNLHAALEVHVGSGKSNPCAFKLSGKGDTSKWLACGYCTQCDASKGFYVSWWNWNGQGTIGQNCVCGPGFYQGSGSCIPCNSTLVGCQSCSSSSKCDICATGTYVKVGNICVVCSASKPGCAVCGTTKCSTCLANYYMTSSGTCTLCSLTYPGCYSCTSSKCSVCDASMNFVNSTGKCVCSPNTVLSGSACVSCQGVFIGCLTCSTTGGTNVCLSCNSTGNFEPAAVGCKCQSGFRYNGSSCVTCASVLPGCLDCDSSNCLTCDPTQYRVAVPNGLGLCDCESGYYSSANVCLSCNSAIPQCTQCSASNLCTQCASGYYAFSPTSCQPCFLGCLSCTDGTASSCSGCTANYTSNGGTPSTCTLDSGFVVVPITGIPTTMSCQNLYGNCDTCDAVSCLTASTGYYLGPNNTVQSCTDVPYLGCSVCDGTDPANPTCTACDITRHYLATPAVAPATPGCQCESVFYYQDTSACLPCVDGGSFCGTCTDASTCLSCTTGYFLPSGLGSTCITCDDPTNGSPNCQQCPFNMVTPTCTKCQDGYYLDLIANPLCQPCVPPCLTCLDATQCTDCVLGTNRTVNSTTNACECSLGYQDNAGQCLLCMQATTGCSECASNICSACDPLLNFELTPLGSGTWCQCNPNYALASGVCVPCSSVFSNCSQCTTNTTCSTCDTGFYVGTGGSCQPCSNILGCQQCSSSTSCVVPAVGYILDPNNIGACITCGSSFSNCAECQTNGCTQCVSNSYAVEPSGVNCQLCASFYSQVPLMLGCLTCSSSSICDGCDGINLFAPNGNGGCVCIDGYALNGLNCQSCGSLMPNCISCVVQNQCLSCLVGSQISTSGPCQPCLAGCLECDLSAGCLLCSSSDNFQPDTSNNQCKCIMGYVQMGGVCTTVCGDGILIVGSEVCDDGNLVNGDGCNSQCLVENDWSCSSPPLTQSTCGYQGKMTVNFGQIKKDPTKNQITVTFSIGPNLPFLSSLNFSKAFTNNLKLSKAKFTLGQNGTVTLTYDYTQTMEGEDASFVFDPSLASSAFYAVNPVSTQMKMTSQTNQPITYYNNDTYQKVVQFKYAYIVGEALSYAILAGGMFCDKIIGIELFGVWQVAFLSLSNINNVQPLLGPLLEFKSLNGYNMGDCYKCKGVPERVGAIQYQPNMASNFNMMLLILVAELAVAGVLYGVSYFATNHSQMLKNICRRLLKEYLLMITLFNTLNIGYSLGLQISYGTPQVLDVVVSIASVLFLVGSFIGLTFADKSEYSQFNSLLRYDWPSQNYFQITILYRFVLGVLMSQLNESPNVTIVCFFLAICFLMYQVSNLPFIEGYHNYRAITQQVTLIAVVGIAMFYRSMRNNQPVAVASQILEPAYLQIIGLYLCVVLSAGCLGYEMYIKFLQGWVNNLLAKRAKESDKQVTNQILEPELNPNESNHSNILFSES